MEIFSKVSCISFSEESPTATTTVCEFPDAWGYYFCVLYAAIFVFDPRCMLILRVSPFACTGYTEISSLKTSS